MVQCQIRWNMILAFQEFKQLRGLTEWHLKSNKKQHNGKPWYLKGRSLKILICQTGRQGGGQWARLIREFRLLRCLMKMCWFSLTAVLQLNLCFREKLWKSTNPVEHRSHQNTELPGKGFKGKIKCKLLFLCIPVWGAVLFSHCL